MERMVSSISKCYRERSAMSGYCQDCGNTQCLCTEMAADEAKAESSFAAPHGSANPRNKWHRMLDEAMNETKEGDFFLPQFVRLVLKDAKPNRCNQL